MATHVLYSDEDGEQWAEFIIQNLGRELSSRFPLQPLTVAEALQTYPAAPQSGWVSVKGVSLLVLTPGLEEFLCENPDCTLLRSVPESAQILLCGVDEDSFLELDAQPRLPQTRCNVRSISGEKQDTEQLIQHLANFISTHAAKCVNELTCDKSPAGRTVRTKPPKYGQGCEHKLYPRKLLTSEKTDFLVLLRHRHQEGDTLRVDVTTPKGLILQPLIRKVHSSAFQFSYQGQCSGRHEVQVWRNDSHSLGCSWFEARDPHRGLQQVSTVYLALLQQLIVAADLPGATLDALCSKVLTGHSSIPMAAMRHMFAGCHIGPHEHAVPSLFHLATQHGLQETVAALVDLHDARMACRAGNNEGATPADIARSNGHGDIAEFLDEFLDASIQEEGLYAAMEECYSVQPSPEELDTYSTYADMKEQRIAAKQMTKKSDEECDGVLPSNELLYEICTGGHMTQAPCDNLYSDLETTCQEAAALQEDGYSDCLHELQGSTVPEAAGNDDGLYMPMEGARSSGSTASTTSTLMEDAVEDGTSGGTKTHEEGYLNEDLLDYKKTPEPFDELLTYDHLHDSRSDSRPSKPSDDEVKRKDSIASTSSRASTVSGASGSVMSIWTDDSLWSSSQRDLMGIMNQVKEQHITIDQAEELFKTWQEQNKAGKSNSFKDKQEQIKLLQKEYQEAQVRLKKDRSSRWNVFKTKKKAKKSDVPAVVPGMSKHYRKSIIEQASVPSDSAPPKPPEKEHGSHPVQEVKRLSTVSNSSSGSGSSYMSNCSAVSCQDSGVESQTYDEVGGRSESHLVHGLSRHTEEDEEEDKSGTLKAEDSSSAKSCSPAKVPSMVNRPLPPTPTPELPPRNFGVPPLPPRTWQSSRRCSTSSISCVQTPRTGNPASRSRSESCRDSYRGNPAQSFRARSNPPTPERPTFESPGSFEEAAATRLPCMDSSEEIPGDTQLPRSHKNVRVVHPPSPPARISSKLTQPLEKCLQDVHSDNAVVVTSIEAKETPTPAPRKLDKKVEGKPGVPPKPGAVCNYPKIMIGDLSNSPLFKKQQEQQDEDSSNC